MILTVEDRAHYEAGWKASRRSTTYDLDAAETRHDQRHPGDRLAFFAAGWGDFAADRPFGWSLREFEPSASQPDPTEAEQGAATVSTTPETGWDAVALVPFGELPLPPVADLDDQQDEENEQIAREAQATTAALHQTLKFTAVRDERGTTYLAKLPHPVLVGFYEDRPATHIAVWYNRTTRDWVVHYSLDEHGSQVGGSDYVYDRAGANEIAEWLMTRAIETEPGRRVDLY